MLTAATRTAFVVLLASATLAATGGQAQAGPQDDPPIQITAGGTFLSPEKARSP
jgi:hypothetical protein